MNKKYQPGVHLLATLQSSQTSLLTAYEGFSQLIAELISRYELKELGNVCHNFESGGFTAVICLSESHISIHTWPEFGHLNIDIYLSNFKRVNDDAVQYIFDDVISFFQAEILHFQKIIR